MSVSNSLKCGLMGALSCAGLFVSTGADAFIYTVGGSGTGQNCSFATVQAAIDAAESTDADDEIWITRDVAGGYYQNQALLIEGLRGGLKIVGGFDNCHDVTPSGVTELHGNGGPRESVLRIYGGDVSLANLRFTRGDVSAHSGAGISYLGSGSLLIEDSIIDNNESLSGGGGIGVVANGGRVTFTVRRTEISDNRSDTFGGGIQFSQLSLSAPQIVSAFFGADVRINRNYARQGGGGLMTEGWTILQALDGGFQMHGNGTLGDGGAILAETRPLEVYIATGGVVGSMGTFVGNEARNGGAIALSNRPDATHTGGDAFLALTSYDFAHPLVFSTNRAHERGGAIYVNRPRIKGPLDGATRVCSFNAGYAGNDATLAGSAVSVTGSSAFFGNQAQNVGCKVPSELCTHFSCNHYSDHTATLANGQPSGQGSLFDARDSADIQLFAARIANNTVPWLFRTSGNIAPNASAIGVDTALIYANSGTSLGMTQCAAGSCLFDMVASTVVGNTFAGPVFTNSPRDFALQESIIDQPGVPLFAEYPSGTSSTLAHLLYTSNHVSNIPTVRQGPPGFRNVAGMDYRLSDTSQAIDNLPARDGVDFTGRDRNVDITWRPDRLGPRDLGAVEAQLSEFSELIFRNGFD